MIVTVNGYSITKEAYDSLTEQYGISIITLLLIGDYSDKVFEVNEYGSTYTIYLTFDKDKKLVMVTKAPRNI